MIIVFVLLMALGMYVSFKERGGKQYEPGLAVTIVGGALLFLLAGYLVVTYPGILGLLGGGQR